MFAAALLAAACQSKQKPPTPPPPPASVTIHANDFSFDAPLEIPTGVTTFHLVNDGPGLHHALFVRLDSGTTVADLLLSLKTRRALPARVKYVGGLPCPGHEERHAALHGRHDEECEGGLSGTASVRPMRSKRFVG